MEATFKCDDILITSYLLTQEGITLVKIIEDTPRHFTFILSNISKCIQLKQLYLNNAPAPARQLFSTREMLISEIKNRHKNGEKYETR